MSLGRSSLRGLSNWFLPIAILLCLVFAAELFLSARQESQTFDEPAHLYAGYSYWLHRDYGVNPEHPPLVKLVATLPLLVDKPPYPPPMDIFFRAASAMGGIELLSHPDAQALLAHSRVAVSVFAFLLGLLIVLAAYEMFGRGTALFALALFAFDPDMIANGPLIGTDIGATCFIFATVYAFYRYGKRPSWARLGVCALAAGLALAAKHSALIIFPLLLLLCVVEIVLRKRQADEGATGGRLRYALRLAGALIVIGLVSVAILWAFYGFRYAARPDGKQITPPTAVYLQSLHHPFERRVIAFAERHHLLPESYLFGLTDVTILSNQGREMYLFGKIYPQGRWYYFPSAFLIKMTIGFLLLLLLIPFAQDIWRRERLRETLFLLVPAVAYGGVAVLSKLDIGIRHLIPVMPFLFVLAAASAVSFAHRSRGWAWAVSILFALHVVSSLRAFPNYLPYSNEIVGGPSATHRMLSDSNVGWGGGLKALHAYIVKHHITSCWLAYSALSNPQDFQIPCKQLPTFFVMLSDTGRQQAVPADLQGPVFISSEEIAGSFWGAPAMNPYLQFTKMRPAHVIAGEILEFDGDFSAKSVASASHLVMALTLLRQRKNAQAVAQGEVAVALDPDLLYAHETLTDAYAANHQPDNAMREYRVSLQLFQDVDQAFVKDMEAPNNPQQASH
ncbi:MAG: phospholipid carrier-dependent glycosyltransferase [Silvibacterium sp.]